MSSGSLAQSITRGYATNRRFVIMGLLFVTVVINYLDRANLSIAAPGIAAQFNMDPVRLGVVFSAFGWFYTSMQLPGGWVVDRVNPRLLYPVTASSSGRSRPLRPGPGGRPDRADRQMRGAIGFFEAPSFLMNNRIATTWFGEEGAGDLCPRSTARRCSSAWPSSRRC